MKRVNKFAVSITLLVVMLFSTALAFEQAQTADIYAISGEEAEPRWSYIYKISNGLGIDQYEVTINASTIAYGNNHAYVTAVLQQKQANGSYEDYATYDDDGVAGAAIATKLTVPYGTYRIVSYHSAGNGTNMEYKTLTGPNKRVPHDTGK